MALLLTMGAGSSLTAEEIHSNGIGGGEWSDPGSWREKKVPGENDDAVISRGDILEFDRNDDGKISCKQIYIDPKGVLTLKTGSGRIVCSVAGAIESYGMIKLDGSRSATDKLELRFVGPAPENRALKLMKGGALVVNGRRSLAHGRHNVSITSGLADEKMPIMAEINAGAAATIDIQRAELISIFISANTIDNTGVKPNERMNLADNHWTGLSNLYIASCDSPVIVNNLIELTGATVNRQPAIFVNASPLAELRGNTIRGNYTWGIMGRSQVDSAVTDTTLDGCNGGLYWYGTNGMFKDIVIRKCDTGVVATSMSGVFENMVIDGCRISYSHGLATAQLTNVQIINLPKSGSAVSYTSGPLTLLNCNIKAEDIKLLSKAAKKVKDGVSPVVSLNYLIAKPLGKVPPGALIEVRTENLSPPLPAGAADPNVRNSPAKILSNGLTSLPASLEPLIVKSWSIDDELNIMPSPQYRVSVVVPAAQAGQTPRELATMKVTPDETWIRPDVNVDKPTLEIQVP